MSNITDTNSSEHNLAGEITVALTGICLYIIGVYLHVKIIIASKRDKEMTWKMDITNSVMIIIMYTNAIFMHTITYMIPDLHLYTGKWFCYVEMFISCYLITYQIRHSTVIAMLKYIIVVRDDKARDFGRERIIQLFFWINLLHPTIEMALHLIVRPDFLWAYGGLQQINNCLGNTENPTKLHTLCYLTQPLNQYSFEYTVSILRQIICWLHVIIFYVLLWNLLDVFLYYKIFTYARR